MSKISNDDFILLIKKKDFLNDLDNLLENIPRKDMYYKDKIRKISINLLNEIFKCNYESNLNNTTYYIKSIKSKISLIDFMLERFYYKTYISEKALFKITSKLVEINKIASSWLYNMLENAS